MSEPASPAAPQPPKPDAWGQLTTALAIVGALWTIALGLVIVGGIMLVNAAQDKGSDLAKVMAFAGVVMGPIGMIAGALSQALQAPTGISNVVRAVTAGKGDGR